MTDPILSAQQISEANRIYELLRQHRPMTRADLKNYIKVFAGIDIPDTKICADHNTPMDYLWHCYNKDYLFGSQLCAGGSSMFNYQPDGMDSRNGDCVVWAGRGGGKTLIAAIATLLDCIFKPRCKVRILAGSELQAQRMFDYLIQFLNYRGFEKFLAEPACKNKCLFVNGSDVQVLSQSAASVRGSHIHKLRCDEVELFDTQILEMAKFTTQTTDGITAAMECLSTMHQPFGIMHGLVANAQSAGIPVFKWCVWEVLERCLPERSCSRCPLNSDCQGKARRAAGYFKIDDLITQMRRSSRAGFESEILCLKPSLANVVFAEFEPDIHIAVADYNPDLPTYRAIDFGFVNPFVCLWIQVDHTGTVRVIDEYVKSRLPVELHAQEIKSRAPYREENIVATFCDPAGAAVDSSGMSAAGRLSRAGIKLRYRHSSILQGIELIRRALRTADGRSSFVVSPRCGRLIEAMQCYHYPPAGCDEMPLKDGIYDHPIDALRYFFVNYQTSNPAKNRRY